MFGDRIQVEAFKNMHRERCCPPLEVLRQGGLFVEKHLALCEACREDVKNYDFFVESAQLLKKFKKSSMSQDPVRKGDVRRILPDTPVNTWFDKEGSYFNPPLVLVLTDPDKDGFAQVAQIFGDADLRDLGDIPLNEGEMGYAEAWNIYSLPVTGMGKKALFKVADAEVDEVLKAAEFSYPHLDPHSPLFQFRLLEAETGSFFSWGLMTRALHQLESVHKANLAKNLEIPESVKDLPSTLEKVVNFIPDSMIAPDYVFQPTFGYAAATRSITIPMKQENTCVIEYEDGLLLFSVDFVPSSIKHYIVALYKNKKAVELKDKSGQISEKILLSSEAVEERLCDLDEKDFKRCEVRIWKIQKDEEEK